MMDLSALENRTFFAGQDTLVKIEKNVNNNKHDFKSNFNGNSEFVLIYNSSGCAE